MKFHNNKVIFLLLTLVFFSLIAPSVKSLDLKTVECKTDGSFEFTIEGTDDDEIHTKDMTVWIDNKVVKGVWDREGIKDSYSVNQRYATFSLPETSLTENKIYKIALDYKEEDQDKTKFFNAECSGLLFSCTLLHINIDKCYTENGHFTAEITAKGLKQSTLPNGFNIDPNKALDFTINTFKPYKAKTNIVYKRGALPSEFKITEIEPDKYALNFDLEQDNYVKGIGAYFSEERDYPLYMLDKCRTDEYNLKLGDYEACTFYTYNQPVIVTQEQDKEYSSENKKANEQENAGNLVTGQVLKDQKSSSNYLYTAIIVALVLIIIGLYYQNKKKRW